MPATVGSAMLLKCTASRVAFRDALDRVATTIPTRKAVPVLQCVLVTAEQPAFGAPRLRLFGTDLDQSITVDVLEDDAAPVTVGEPGAVALPVALLKHALQHAEGNIVCLAVDAGNRAELRVGRARYKIGGLAADEMPTIRDLPPDPHRGDARIPAGALQRAIRRISYAASLEPSRPILNSVVFQSDADGALLLACDDRRCAGLRLPAIAGLPDEAILPLKAAEALGTIFAPDDLVTVRCADGLLGIASATRWFCTRVIDGPFPPWRRLFRATSPLTVTFDRAALAAAVRRVAFLAESTFQSIGLAFTAVAGDAGDAGGDGMVGALQCRLWTHTSDQGGANDTLAGTATGLPAEGFVIGCGAGFLLGALTRTFTGPQVVLAFDGARSPILLHDADDPAAFAIIGPLFAPPLPEA